MDFFNMRDTDDLFYDLMEMMGNDRESHRSQIADGFAELSRRILAGEDIPEVGGVEVGIVSAKCDIN